MKFLTDEQKVVAEAKIKDGYEYIGMFTNVQGVAGHDIGLVKGRHRVHISALGYDSYVPYISYQEVK